MIISWPAKNLEEADLALTVLVSEIICVPWIKVHSPHQDTTVIYTSYRWSQLRAAEITAAYLQVDLDDSVKLILLHVEQEVVLRDARCVHTHWGRLKETSLKRERTLTVNTRERERKRTRCDVPAAYVFLWNVAHHDNSVCWGVFYLYTHLYTCDQLLYTLFWRHIHHSRHVTLSSEVTRQALQGLIGRLLADVSNHHGGPLRGEALTHRPSNPTASTWI